MTGNTKMVKATGYLVVNDKGFVHFKKNPPAVNVGEAAFFLELHYPVSMVRVPTIKAHITIPPESIQPLEIEAEAITQIQEAVRTASGMDVRIQLVDVDEKGDD